jgi:hypothetical protein
MAKTYDFNSDKFTNDIYKIVYASHGEEMAQIISEFAWKRAQGNGVHEAKRLTVKYLEDQGFNHIGIVAVERAIVRYRRDLGLNTASPILNLHQYFIKILTNNTVVKTKPNRFKWIEERSNEILKACA